VGIPTLLPERFYGLNKTDAASNWLPKESVGKRGKIFFAKLILVSYVQKQLIDV
jgi:hypothetical protein